MKKRLLHVMYFLAIVLFIAAPCFADSQVIVEKDIYFKSSGKKNNLQMLDIYRPKGKKDLPVLIFIHGGGWRKGDKSQYQRIGRYIASKDVVTVIANYRLSPAVKHPAHTEDAAAAFAWVYKNIKKYGGDPNMIFISGHSAGAHISALLLTDEKYLKKHNLSTDKIYGAILIGGVYYLGFGTAKWKVPPKSSLRKKMLTPAFGSDPDVLRDASPYCHARANIPPTMILAGAREYLLLKFQARHFYNVLSKKGAPVRFKLIPGKNHFTEIASMGRFNDRTTPIILEFIKFRSYD